MIFFFLTFILLKKHEYDCLNIINLYRQEHGLKPLIVNPKLEKAARMQSKHQKDIRTCTHAGPIGNELFYVRIMNAGYDALGTAENVAQGYGTEYVDLVERWKKSLPHNKNILNPIYNETGIACEIDTYDNKSYWTQVFAEKDNRSNSNIKIEDNNSKVMVKPELMSCCANYDCSYHKNRVEMKESKIDEYEIDVTVSSEKSDESYESTEQVNVI